MENILLLQAARFGDLVQTKRLAVSLQKKYNVHICVDNSLEDVAKIIYPYAQIHKINFHSRPDLNSIKINELVFANLKDIKFKKIYNCNFSPLTEAICRLFPDDIIVGYRPLHHSDGGIIRSPWARLFFNLGRNRSVSTLNLVDYWAWQLEAPISPGLVNPPAKSGGDGLGIVLAGRESRRSLPPPILANISQIIFQLLNPIKIKLFGTKAEAKQAKALTRYFSPAMLAKTEDLTGRTNWQELAIQLTSLDLLLSPDTGTMHFAAHLGVPVMAFFLSSAFCHETAPYGEGHFIWQAIEECSPCLECNACPHGVKCLGIFKNPQFGRFLAASLSGDSLEYKLFPDGLQFWQTAFDNLGQYLQIKGGTDRQKEIRLTARNFIKNFLDLEYDDNLYNLLPENRLKELISELFPEQDWMLPAERYY